MNRKRRRSTRHGGRRGSAGGQGAGDSEEEDEEDDEEGDDGGDDEGDDDDDDDAEDGVLDVDFDFFDPDPEDVRGITQLLANYFLQHPESQPTRKKQGSNNTSSRGFEAKDLAGTICEQAAVGTTIKTSPEGQPLAFLTVLNVQSHRDLQESGVPGVIGFLRPRVTTEVRKFLEEGERKLGLLVSSRFLNLPFPLVPPLHSSFLEDLAWARKELDRELAETFEFTHFLMVVPMFKLEHRVEFSDDDDDGDGGEDEEAEEKSEVQPPPKKKARTAPDSRRNGREELTGLGYVRFEEELLAEKAVARCLLKGVQDDHGRCLQVIVISAQEYRRAVQKLPEFMLAQSSPQGE